MSGSEVGQCLGHNFVIPVIKVVRKSVGEVDDYEGEEVEPHKRVDHLQDVVEVSAKPVKPRAISVV